MKRKAAFIVTILVLLFGCYFFGFGLVKLSSAYISDFAISYDGTEMTVKIFVADSVGFVRKVSVHQQHGGKLYLDCYSAFGGINGSIGAKSEYTIQLDEDTEIIALYRNNNCYEEVLQKDDNGNWQRVH